MSDVFLGEIRVFPYNFVPRNWADCNGQLLPISQNTALFSLLGTIYGGDGKSTFALPDLRGTVPMHPGQGLGLTDRMQGETVGSETVTLLESELPTHGHTLQATGGDATSQSPGIARMIARGAGAAPYHSTTNANLTTMAVQTLATAGAGLAHTNVQPSLVLRFCIALAGIFPQRHES